MQCDYCLDKEARFRCNWCDRAYCGHHRLPENHDCDGSQHEYQESNQNTVDPMDSNSIERTGKRPTGDFGESSPNVAPDGSIVRGGNGSDSQNEDADQSPTLIDKLLFWR